MNSSAVETVEYMWVDIWCLLDWIIGLCHKNAEMHFPEHSGTSPLTKKRSKWKKKKKNQQPLKENMLICDQPVSFDDYKVLASSNSEFHLKIKESLLISCSQPVLNKNEAFLLLHLFDWFHKYFTLLWLFSFTIHTLLFTFCCFQ